MREIICRGLDKRNHWHEGALVKHYPYTPNPIGDSYKESEYQYLIAEDEITDWGMPRNIQLVRVIPESVGQYIGKKDKKGIKIFEGDIVKDENNLEGVITYSVESSSFLIKFKDYSQAINSTEKVEIVSNVFEKI